MVTNVGSNEVIKAVGQTYDTSLSEFGPTNVTEVLLDSIKKITDCNALAYKAIDDTIPILETIAPKCNIDHVKDSLSQLDTLSKFIVGNVITIDKVNEDTFKEKMEKEKEKLFEDTIKKCTEHINTLLSTLNTTILEYKELYRETCKPHLLTQNIEKKISRVQKEIDDIADNIIGSFKPISFIEQEIVGFEEKLEKFEKEKARIKANARELKHKLSPKLDNLISLRNEISKALIQGERSPAKHMHHLIGTIQ